MTHLKEYYEKLDAAQEKERQKSETGAIARVETPEDVPCKTIWIPKVSWNRTARIDLNHTLFGFDEEDGELYGANGNCGTPYVILEVPKHWDYTYVDELAERMVKKLEKPANYPTLRVLKADDRLPLIKEEINKMIEEEAHVQQ